MSLLKIEPALIDSVANFTFGNVTATSFTGNGSLLTAITGSNVTGIVANATYATTAATVTTAAQPNITSVGTLTSLSVTGNITTGNVTGANSVTSNYFVGNGSLLTGLPASYADSNVASYLPTYTGNLSPSNLSVSTHTTLGDAANVTITGGLYGQFLSTDGTGNLSWATASGGGGGGGPLTYVTRKYTANGTGNTYTVTNGCSVDNVLVFVNGICQAPTDDYTISTTTLTLDGIPVSGTKIHIRELPR